MNIEEIMKPYFDKKEEIENKSVVSNLELNNEIESKKEEIQNKESQINLIELRLNKLRENKETEIEDYVKQIVSNSSNFYSGYVAMVRKDLEQAYLEKEQSLEKEIYNKRNEIEVINHEIFELNKKINTNLNRIENFNRVDIRELANLKTSLVKPLISAKKELEIQLRETQIRNEIIMLKLSEFKYKYDENGKVLNDNEFKNLFEQSNELVERKYNLQSQIDKVNEYINLMELTQEEINVLMMSMTPWEKEEYDRRKLASKTETISEKIPSLEELFEKTENIVETETVVENDAAEKIEEVKEPEIIKQPAEEIKEPKTYDEVKEETTEESKDEFDSYEDLYETIYEDVLNSARKLRSIKLDGNTLKTMKNKEQSHDFEGEAKLDLNGIELPNGSYFYQSDIKTALNNYKEANKGRTFKVKGIEQNFEVTKGVINKVKSQLKKCSIISLFREKKLGKFDIMKVYGKEKSEEYLGDIEIGEVQTKAPEGEYINLQEFAQTLKETFREKSLSWTEKLKNSFNNLFSYDNLEVAEEIENSDVIESDELEETYAKTR